MFNACLGPMTQNDSKLAGNEPSKGQDCGDAMAKGKPGGAV